MGDQLYCVCSFYPDLLWLILSSYGYMWPWSTKPVFSSQKYTVWVKIINFYFMPKIIRILRSCSMKIFCTFLNLNVYKYNFWLVICLAKNFLWTTLKMIFSIFRFILHSLAKLSGFVVQGHIYHVVSVTDFTLEVNREKWTVCDGVQKSYVKY